MPTCAFCMCYLVRCYATSYVVLRILWNIVVPLRFNDLALNFNGIHVCFRFTQEHFQARE